MVMFLERIEFDEHVHYKSFQNVGLDIIGPHCHKQVEVIYGKSGTSKIGLENSIIDLHANEIIYFSPGQLHYFLPSPDSQRYVFLFDLSIFDEVNLRKKNEQGLLELLDSGENCSQQWPPELTEMVCPILEVLFKKTDRDLVVRKPGEDYFALGCLNLLISAFYEFLPKKKICKFDISSDQSSKYQDSLKQLNKVIEFVQNNYENTIYLEDIAAHIGFNRYYFTKFFKKLTGETFITFLNNYRIQQAKYILINERVPMTEVAERSGFKSTKTFYALFKKLVGESPLQYQKKL